MVPREWREAVRDENSRVVRVAYELCVLRAVRAAGSPVSTGLGNEPESSLRRLLGLTCGAVRRLGDWRPAEVVVFVVPLFVEFEFGITLGVDVGADTLSWREVLGRIV